MRFILPSSRKSINSVFLGNGRGKNIWSNGPCTREQRGSILLSRSVCLMINQFYSDELALSKCIIWSVITRATVLMFRSGHGGRRDGEGWTSNSETCGLCVRLSARQAKVERCWTLIIHSDDSWMVIRPCLFLGWNLKKSLDLSCECLAE